MSAIGAANAPSNRLTFLDAMRGLAAVGVLLYHYCWRYTHIFPNATAYAWTKYGYLGVHVFFIISGFVIFMTVERSKTVMDFPVGRLTRLYPTFWVCCTITWLLVSICGLPGRETSITQYLGNMTIVGPTFGVKPVDGAYWSLGVEMIFYVLVYGLWLLKLETRWRVMCWIWLVLSAVITFIDRSGLVFLKMLHVGLLLNYTPLFVLGILCYQLMKNRVRKSDVALVFACLLVASALFKGSEVVVIGLSAGIIAALSMMKAQIRIPKIVIWLGAISYPLYLLHQNIGYIVIRYCSMLGLSRIAGIIIAFTISILLASVVHVYVEETSRKKLRQHVMHLVQSRDTGRR